MEQLTGNTDISAGACNYQLTICYKVLFMPCLLRWSILVASVFCLGIIVASSVLYLSMS